eukprot:gene5302-947_t
MADELSASSGSEWEPGELATAINQPLLPNPSGEAGQSDDGALSQQCPIPLWQYVPILLVLVALQVGDLVLGAVLFFHWGQDYSQFLNQATGIIYGLWSIPIVFLVTPLVSKYFGSKGPKAPTKPAAPWWTLVVCGLMNGAGNFLQAVGQVHTPGQTQNLLQLVGLPTVMVLSWVFLQKTQSSFAAVCAAIIVAGSAVAVVPSFLHSGAHGGGMTVLWYSVVIFLSAQIFFGGEKVYEEFVFRRYSVDVFRMFLWVVWTQTPTHQCIDVFGGLLMADIPDVLWDGLKCAVGHTTHGPLDPSHHPFYTPVPDHNHSHFYTPVPDKRDPPNLPGCNFMLPFMLYAYCVVDYSCYAFQLYILKRGGANLLVVALAVALPLTQVVYTIKPMMQGNYEAYNGWYGASMGTVLVGFILYQFSPEGRKVWASEGRTV